MIRLSMFAAIATAAMAMFQDGEEPSPMKKQTPVLVVDSIEDCLPFWVDRLGFEKTMEVPDGESLAFVGLKSGGVEVMLQTRKSIKDDIPILAEGPYRAALFIEVEDLDPIRKAFEPKEHVMPERKTFYGSTEILLKDPVGNILTFAWFDPSQER